MFLFYPISLVFLSCKLIYPHTINIFHHSYHFLSPIQHAHTSLKSSKSNTYKTKRPLYSTWLYKGLFLRYLLYFLLSIALSFCPWEDEGRCLKILTIRPRADTPLILPTTLPLSPSHPQLDYASLHLAVCCRQILSHKDNLYPFGYRSLDNKYAPLHVNMQDALLLSDICYADVVFMNLCLARYHSNSLDERLI